MTNPDGQTGAAPAFPARIDSAIGTLNPAYFAIVMATGIISVAMSFKGITVLSRVMLAITAIAWVLLVVLTIVRIVRHRAKIRADFTDPRRGFGFFTFTAATGVLGTRLVDAQWGVSVGLLVVAAVSWFILGYVVPWTAVLHPSTGPALPNANGTWFIWVVAGQSVAVLSATLGPTVDSGKNALALLAVFSFAVGAFLYPAVALLVAVRMMLYTLKPEDVVPAYWIAMGAPAITVLAGSKIVLMDATPMVDATRGLIAGASVTFWAFGTWLIPVLIAAGCWRHIIHRQPLDYGATLWSIIFPLGMYAVASHFLGTADHLPVLTNIGSIGAWVALAMWALVFVSMCVHQWNTLVLGRTLANGQPAAS